MNVEVVAVGTELLLGQIVDTNSSWIGEQLALAGLNSHFQTKVGDNRDRIHRVLELALDRSDAVICCGGLGPTHDDITREVIADVLGVDMDVDDEVLARIDAMFTSRGRTMSPNNIRQAMVPEGASVIAQQPGTAPGLVCPVERNGKAKVIYAVPGVPYEMQEMVLGTIIPDLTRRSGSTAVIRSRVLRTWGTSESGLAERLAHRIEELDALGNPTLAFLASGVEGLKVRITAKADSEEEVQAIIAAEEALIRPLLGEFLFGVDDQNMERVVVDLLTEAKLTCAVAESVTGGYVAGRICSIPGVSSVFKGGVVAYDPAVKFDLLEVPEGPVVSEDAALAMASGVRKAMGADLGLATTGVAGPDEVEGQPVGTVCLAVVGPRGQRSVKIQMPGDRERIRQFSTITLLNMLRTALPDLA